MTTKFKVGCGDGRVLSATRYQAAGDSGNRLILINSALGVRQSFYQALALYLAARGYTVVTWDPRSIGESRKGNIKRDPARLRDWGMLDLEAVLQHLVDANWATWQTITLLGHSAGGHLVGLCPSLSKIQNIILVSSGTCSWHLYPIRQWPKMWFAWYLMIPTLAKALGYVPGKFGIGHDLPRGVAMDWRNWSISRHYLFSDDSLGETYYHRYAGAIRAIGFSDDVGYSPESTIQALMKRFPNAQKQVQIVRPRELSLDKVGHFGLFKPDNQPAWQRLLVHSLDSYYQNQQGCHGP